MSGFPEYAQYDGLGLAALVREKQVSPRELVDEAIARIERDNPKLNAVIRPLYDSARATADAPIRVDAPFAGVPFLAKDLVSTWAGQKRASGMRGQRDWVAPHDSEIVKRYRHAGLIVVGKTNTPELGLLPVTEPLAFGPTRNPWDLSRTPGGSSGGSGAAVAAGMVPIAGGGDGGGSIRIPASCCGLFGLKPTRGRTPAGPDVGEAWQGCAIEHVLTRTVRDSAAMLDAISGPDAGAPYVAMPPARPFLDEMGAPPGRLRIGYTTRGLIDVPIHADCARAVEDAARLLADLGHDVAPAHPVFDAHQFSRDFITMLVGETAADVREVEAVLGKPLGRGDLERETAALALLGSAVSAEDFALAVRRIKRLGRQLAPYFETWDLLLTPTLAMPPIPVGAMASSRSEALLLDAATTLRAGALLKRIGALDRVAGSAWNFTPFTAMWNATGQPACSVPLSLSEGGLPVGVQFVARLGEEATLLRLASQLEAARPWADRRPPGF